MEQQGTFVLLNFRSIILALTITLTIFITSSGIRVLSANTLQSKTIHSQKLKKLWPWISKLNTWCLIAKKTSRWSLGTTSVIIQKPWILQPLHHTPRWGLRCWRFSLRFRRKWSDARVHWYCLNAVGAMRVGSGLCSSGFAKFWWGNSLYQPMATMNINEEYKMMPHSIQVLSNHIQATTREFPGSSGGSSGQ